MLKLFRLLFAPSLDSKPIIPDADFKIIISTWFFKKIKFLKIFDDLRSKTVLFLDKINPKYTQKSTNISALKLPGHTPGMSVEVGHYVHN